jgi:hypothetical protein
MPKAQEFGALGFPSSFSEDFKTLKEIQLNEAKEIVLQVLPVSW